jgi:hypothetical protein
MKAGLHLPAMPAICASTAILLIGMQGNVIIQARHEPTDIGQAAAPFINGSVNNIQLSL